MKTCHLVGRAAMVVGLIKPRTLEACGVNGWGFGHLSWLLFDFIFVFQSCCDNSFTLSICVFFSLNFWSREIIIFGGFVFDW